MKKLMYLNHITILSNICLFLFTFFSCIPSSISDQQPPVLCGLMDCGRGTCKASAASVVGFECDCHPGWKKIQVLNFTLPSCNVPNCTINLNCGGLPTPHPPSPLPSLSLSDPCGLQWCGDGKCVSNGTGYSCQCYEESANLMNSSALPCFKKCGLGSDCTGLDLLPTSPPPSSSSSGRNGSGPVDASNCSSNIQAFAVILLSAVLLTWL